jgi:hypothetical protein
VSDNKGNIKVLSLDGVGALDELGVFIHSNIKIIVSKV